MVGSIALQDFGFWQYAFVIMLIFGISSSIFDLIRHYRKFKKLRFGAFLQLLSFIIICLITYFTA